MHMCMYMYMHVQCMYDSIRVTESMLPGLWGVQQYPPREGGSHEYTNIIL